MDYATGEGGEGMSVREATAVEAAQDQARAACPGWQVWPVRFTDGRMEWSAQPDGANGAVITGEPSAEAVVKAVRAYEAELASHLADARAMLERVPHSGIGLDAAAVATALVTALEALQRRLAGDKADEA